MKKRKEIIKNVTNFKQLKGSNIKINQIVGLASFLLLLIILFIVIGFELYGVSISNVSKFFILILLSINVSVALGVWLGSGTSTGTIKLQIPFIKNSELKLNYNFIGGIASFAISLTLLVILDKMYFQPNVANALGAYINENEIINSTPQGNLHVIYRKDSTGVLKYLNSGGELSAKDTYQIYVMTKEKLNVYIFQYEDNGMLNILFPKIEKMKYSRGFNPVQANSSLILPSENESYYLSETPSNDHIVMIAAKNPLPILEKLLVKAENEGEKLDTKAFKIFRKSVGGIKIQTENISDNLKHLNSVLTECLKDEKGMLVKEINIINLGG